MPGADASTTAGERERASDPAAAGSGRALSSGPASTLASLPGSLAAAPLGPPGTAPTTSLPPEVRRTMRLSLVEGDLVQVFLNWTSGSVIIDYLLSLGAAPWHIALVAACRSWPRSRARWGPSPPRRWVGARPSAPLSRPPRACCGWPPPSSRRRCRRG